MCVRQPKHWQPHSVSLQVFTFSLRVVRKQHSPLGILEPRLHCQHVLESLPPSTLVTLPADSTRVSGHWLAAESYPCQRTDDHFSGPRKHWHEKKPRGPIAALLRANKGSPHSPGRLSIRAWEEPLSSATQPLIFLQDGHLTRLSIGCTEARAVGEAVTNFPTQKVA